MYSTQARSKGREKEEENNAPVCPQVLDKRKVEASSVGIKRGKRLEGKKEKETRE
jgi:hypothetical protein